MEHSEAARVIPLAGRTGRGTPGGGGPDRGDGQLVPLDGVPLPAPARGWEQQLAELVGFLRRRAVGDYRVDEYGFDPDLTDSLLLPLLEPLYEHWLRVDVAGVEHLPVRGGALLVGNHAGCVWPLDSVITALAVRREHPRQRHLRLLGAELLFRTPVVAPLARKLGATLACPEDAERLLRAGELVGVWPEGFKGTGKPWRQRYRLQRFGRGGFVAAALATGTPIVPVSIIGAEESFPMVANLRPLAALLNLPYFPITPTFPWLGAAGLVPLPSKWHIEFAAPIETGGYGPSAAQDPAIVFDLADRVRETVELSLHRLRQQRRSVWR